jgi:hypothetical protein
MAVVFLIAAPSQAQLLNPPYTQGNTYDSETQSFFKDTSVSGHPLLDTLEFPDPEPAPAPKKNRAFLDFINNKAYAADTKIAIMKNDKAVIREEWRKFLGVDIFYPYYKAKEIEDWVSEKGSVKFGNLKGKPKFGDNKFTYTFKMKF